MLKNRRGLPVAATVLCAAIGSAGIAPVQTEAQGEKTTAGADASASRSKASPDGVLGNRGLRKAGRYYVVATEKEIGERFNKIKPIYNVMETAMNRFLMILDAEATVQYLDNERIAAETYIRDLGIQVDNMPNKAVNRAAIQQLRSTQQNTRVYLSDVRGNLQIARKNLVGPARKQAVWREFMKWRADFLESNKQLRPIVDKADAEYAALKKDPVVKDALQTLTKRSSAQVVLGPSKDLKTVISKLRKAEEMVSFDPDAYRRRPKRKSKVQKNSAIGG